uniref:J domain-containing protein n=1 Tax=Mesocestoides corti TaxID=53468 RepID=A0A5K3FU08_MESCO
MKYHPDKNPNGQAKFHAINSAYNFLCNRSRISDGPNRRHIQLLIRSQSILYNRYRRELAPHKYAGYPMLIRTIRMEVEDESLFMKQSNDGDKTSSKTAELLSYATELAYETVATSALNAEELRREGGLQTLQDAFARCSALLSLDDALNNPLAVSVCCHVTGFFTVSTKFPASRECIHEIPQITRDILRLLYYKNLPRLCCQAAACIAAFCDDFWLCSKVYENGGMYMLLYHVLAYDFTLEESGVDTSSATNTQLTLNRLSLLCLWATSRLLHGCSAIASPDESPHEGPPVEQALNRLVTPHIARKLAALGAMKAPTPVANIDRLLDGDFLSAASESGQALRRLAKLLTINSATPCFIWDNQCRAELTAFLDDQVSRLVKTGEADLEAVKAFAHKKFQGELLIGEIFVRIFNKQSTFPLDNSRSFAIDLLHYLEKEVALLPTTSDGLPATTQRVNHIESALEALRNVIRSYAGVEIQCIGHFSILFAILDMNGYTNMKLRSVEVLHSASKNPECLNDIHASKLLVGAVMLFRALPQAQIPLVDFFNHAIAVNALLKELVYAGGLVYLLETIVTSEMRDVRTACVSFLSRCMANAQLGRRIQALLGQFVPAIFPETIRDTPEQFIPLFDVADHQNPELIWNQACRERLSEAIIDMCNKFAKQQQSNRSLRWSLPDSYSVSYVSAISESLLSQGLLTESDISSLEASGGLVVVSGVYLHLYVNQPGWMLRQPDQVLDGLMEKLLDTFRGLPSSAQLLRLLNRATVQLLTDRPGLLDGLPRKGYPHRLFDLFPTVNEPEGAKTCALLLHRMSVSKLCVGAMTERETMAGYLHVMRHCIGEELGTVGECLFNIFNTTGCDPLVAQALKCDLIDYLLQTLHQGLPVTVREPGQCRAYIVKALKVMQKNPVYGTKVAEKLESDPNWAEFRDQSHALFLTNAPQSTASAYLTAGAGGSSMHAGFLTSGTPVPPAAAASSSSSSSSQSHPQRPPAPTVPPMYPMGPGGVPTAPPQLP